MLNNPEKKLSLNALRIRLSTADALPQLTILGLLTGLIAGSLLIGFRELLTLLSSTLVPAGEDNFESLSALHRFLLPVAGSVVIILLVKLIRKKRRSVGVAHVIERLTLHRGRLPSSSVVLQFFTALIALATGFSVGREGPAVHMGAGAGSALGQRLQLPDNTLRILAGCGVATAISVSFNTPLAGVIFAMEVIVKQYSLGSFIPVMAASVVAALMAQFMYGPEPAFHVPAISMMSMEELLIAAVMALCIGVMAGLFISLQASMISRRKGQLVLPILLAGFIMGIAGFLVPSVMGMGYDTLEGILNGSLFSLSTLAILLITKLVVTAVVTGLGIPGGIIGPSLFMGAVSGAVFGSLGEQLLDIPNLNSSFHALLGMVAMMAATLQAPLVALVTVLELTRNPNIIMPAMFVIVIACLTSGRFFQNRGIFEIQLLKGGQNLESSPLHQLLGQTGVASLMNSACSQISRHPSQEELHGTLQEASDWVLICHEQSLSHILAPGKLPDQHSQDLDLLAIPDASEVHSISLQATLYEALELMNRLSVDILAITPRRHTKNRKQSQVTVEACGIITRQAIESYYHGKSAAV
ncbi:chloride channel protein [Endozoicomonas arenosclerae]|uniref:chloride channel protein n=1 Tax=Endozoicomonas arenosclerae TaxID=1633495 RepID=UPI000781E108|nr:chloride channel protein [Endozoicomonas arenosclerae]